MGTASKLLILGAGASYGAETSKDYAPPLASELFDALLKFEPAIWQRVPDDVANTFRRDFEAGMIALAERQPHLLPLLQRSMGGFFFRYGPTANSLYLRLAREIKKDGWDGAIATLNYERLLLLSLGSVGVSCWCGDKGNTEATVEICLPHGCCNLFCESAIGNAALVSMAGMSVTTNGPVISIDNPDAFWNRIRTDAFPPVMSYFEPSKFTTSGANFIAAQRYRLGQLIAEAKMIAVVGVKVRREDEHIWGSLYSTKAPIFYCSGPGGDKEFDTWRDSDRPQDTVSKGNWKDDFESILRHLGL